MNTSLRLFGLSLLIVFFLISCGDDDDNNGIEGTWESTVFSQSDCEDPILNFDEFSCGGCFRNEFRSDGTFTSTINVPGVLDQSVNGTYTIDGNILTTCDENGANCETSTFTLTGSGLMIVTEGLDCVLTVSFERS